MLLKLFKIWLFIVIFLLGCFLTGLLCWYIEIKTGIGTMYLWAGIIFFYWLILLWLYYRIYRVKGVDINKIFEKELEKNNR